MKLSTTNLLNFRKTRRTQVELMAVNEERMLNDSNWNSNEI